MFEVRCEKICEFSKVRNRPVVYSRREARTSVYFGYISSFSLVFLKKKKNKKTTKQQSLVFCTRISLSYTNMNHIECRITLDSFIFKVFFTVHNRIGLYLWKQDYLWISDFIRHAYGLYSWKLEKWTRWKGWVFRHAFIFKHFICLLLSF